MLQNPVGPPAELASIIRPESTTPISEATRLRQKQVEQGIAITGIERGDALAKHLLREEGAGRLNGSQHIPVASHPGEIVGPAASFHVETVILSLRLRDDFLQ